MVNRFRSIFALVHSIRSVRRCLPFHVWTKSLIFLLLLRTAGGLGKSTVFCPISSVGASNNAASRSLPHWRLPLLPMLPLLRPLRLLLLRLLLQLLLLLLATTARNCHEKRARRLMRSAEVARPLPTARAGPLPTAAVLTTATAATAAAAATLQVLLRSGSLRAENRSLLTSPTSCP